MLTQAARRVDGWLSGTAWHPWLFATFPVLRLYSANLTDVEADELIVPLLAVLLATSAGMAVAWLLMRDPRRAALVVSAVLLPVLSFGLMREVLPASLGLGRLGLLALSAAWVAVAVIVARRIGSQLGTLTSTLNALSAVLLVLVAIPAAGGVADAVRTSDAGGSDVAPRLAAPDGTRPTRDIYHIILDRYSSERSFRTGFDIDNSAFTDWLRERGFQVLDDSHANYAWTSLSLASTLGMRLLDDVVAAAGPDSSNKGPLDRWAQRSRAGAFLQDLGYEYHHLGSWFDQTQRSDIADRVYRPRDVLTFDSTLVDLTIVPALVGEGSDGKLDSRSRHARAARFQFAALDEVRDEPGPTYVLAHILLPHPPYVFLEDGMYAPGEASLRSQLTYTNEMLKRFLEPLLALPEEERPIVILQADEGFYPKRLISEQLDFDWAEATDEELITKFGILNAWYLPGPEGEPPLPDDMTPVNTYPELLRRYFGADIADEPDHSYVSPKDHPLRLTDVTERLSAAEAVATEAPPITVSASARPGSG